MKTEEQAMNEMMDLQLEENIVMSIPWSDEQTKQLQGEIPLFSKKINNSNIQEKMDKGQDIYLNIDFLQVNDVIWRVLSAVYGGGPKICKDEIDKQLEKKRFLAEEKEKKKKLKTIKPCGLEGNTEFSQINAILQCLVCIEELNKQFYNEDYKKQENNSSIQPAYTQLIKQMENSPANSQTNANNLREFLKANTDLLETYKELFKNLNPSKNKQKGSNCSFELYWENFQKSNNSIIDRLFAGLFVKEFLCQKCGTFMQENEVFNEIELQAVPGKNNKLEDYFQNFFSPKNHQPQLCEKCNSSQKALQLIKCYVFPKILVICIKRSKESQKIAEQNSYPINELALNMYQQQNLYVKDNWQTQMKKLNSLQLQWQCKTIITKLEIAMPQESEATLYIFDIKICLVIVIQRWKNIKDNGGWFSFPWAHYHDLQTIHKLKTNQNNFKAFKCLKKIKFKMIKQAFSAEFDANYGSTIKQGWPNDSSRMLFNDSLLASQMIPEGAHRHEYDTHNFRFTLNFPWIKNQKLAELANTFNSLNFSIKILDFNENMRKWLLDPQTNENSILRINLFTLKHLQIFSDNFTQSPKIEIEIHKDIQLTQTAKNFANIYSLDGKAIGLLFEGIDELNNQLIEFEKSFDTSIQEKTDNFVHEFIFWSCLIHKRDPSYKRGSIIRAIAICSDQIEILYPFEKVIRFYLDKYGAFPENYNENSIIELLKNLINGINQALDYQKVNYSQYLKINNDALLQYCPIIDAYSQSPKQIISIKTNETTLDIGLDKSFPKSYSDCKLITFIKKFKESTMTIQNSIFFNENKILFLGQNCLIEDLVNQVNCCKLLVSPVNIRKIIQPYEHLLNISFVNKDNFIAGVSNPIFVNRKEWWDLCCDIDKGEVFFSEFYKKKNEKKADLIEQKWSILETSFITEILELIKNNEITESEVKLYFYEQTCNLIDLLANNINIYETDDNQLQLALRKKIDIFKTTRHYKNILQQNEQKNEKLNEKSQFLKQAMTMLSTQKLLNNQELLFVYTTLLKNIQTEENFAFVIKSLLIKRNSHQLLSAGLFSNSEEVVKSALDFFEILEKYNDGKLILKKFSYYILFTQHNMRTKYSKNAKKT